MNVHFACPPEVVFDYLVDPANRPDWQSSLKAVEDVSGEIGVGQTWVDVTTPGLRPLMETTALERPHTWTERGTWRGFSAVLTLDFADANNKTASDSTSAAGSGCDVAVTMRLDGRGLARPLARILTLVSPAAVRSDLRRAAAILAKRHPA